MAPANAARVLPIEERATTTSAASRHPRWQTSEYEVRILPFTGADWPVSVVDEIDEDWLGGEAFFELPAELAAVVDRDLGTSRTWLLGALGRAMDQG